jgi:hypothetical protein
VTPIEPAGLRFERRIDPKSKTTAMRQVGSADHAGRPGVLDRSCIGGKSTRSRQSDCDRGHGCPEK